MPHKFNGMTFKRKPVMYEITKGVAKGTYILVWKKVDTYDIMCAVEGGGAFELLEDEWSGYKRKMGLVKQ